MAKRQAYRNTRTDSIRLSSAPLGFPYERVTAAEAKAAGVELGSDSDGAKASGGKAADSGKAGS